MTESDPTEEELEARYKPVLIAEDAALRAASATSAEARKPVVLDQQSVGRLSRMDALQGQAMAKGLEARRAGRLRAINAALSRMAAGEYGWCDSCGGFIGHGRLGSDPCAVRCLSCAAG